MESAPKLAGVASIVVIHKDGCASRFHRQLQLGGDGRRARAPKQWHRHANFLCPPRLDHNIFHKVAVARLANNDLMFAWQKQDFLIALEFLYIANVRAVDPDTSVSFNAGSALELQLAQDFAVVRGQIRSPKQDAKQSERKNRGGKPRSPVHCAPYFRAGHLW